MSTSVDQRVVEMRFDNAQFEDGVKTSISTLDRLKNALNLNGAGKGLNELENSANSIRFDGLTNALDGASDKFSLLEQVGIGALRNLGAQIESTGTRLIKSLSIDQITAGWSKFEKKTGSVATLVAQGNDLDLVNEQLSRLNWFTDETSYNFTDMVDNIAKFTASGQGLEESVDAMMGIANWAAMSGQNARKASMAMYQLSQAMSKGVLKYDDWKSVQNAGMDNIQFREKAVEVALNKENATLKKVEGGYKTLNGKVFTLSELFTSDAMSRTGWLDKEVMMGTFNKYSSAVNKIYEEQKRLQDAGDWVPVNEVIRRMGGEVDGFGLKAFKAAQEARSFTDAIDATKDAVSTSWMNSFELIFGNYEEATKLWSGITEELWNIFASGGETRNLALEEWKKDIKGGREVLLGGLKNLYFDVKTLVAPISEAFNSVFDIDEKVKGKSLNTKIAKVLISGTKSLASLADKLTITEGAFEKLTIIFEGVWKVVKLVGEAFKTVFDIVKPLFQPIVAIGGVILDLGVYISNLITTFDEWVHSSETVSSGIEFVKNAVQTFSDGLTAAINNLSAYYDVFVAVAELVGNVVVGAFKDLWNGINQLLAPVREFINLHFGDAFERLGNALLTFDVSKIVSTITEIVDKLMQFPAVAKVVNILRIALLGFVGVIFTVGYSIYDFVSGVINAFTTGGFLGVFDLLVEKVKGIGKLISSLLSSNFIVKKITDIKNSIKSLFTKEGATGKLAEIRKFIQDLVRNSGLGEWFQNLKNIIGSFTGPLQKFGQTFLTFLGNLTPGRVLILGFAGALISLITSASGMFKSFKLLANGATDFLTVLSGGKVGKKPNTIRELSIAIGVLALSLALLAAIPSDQLNNATNALLKLAGAMIVIEGLGILADKLKKNNFGSGLKDAATSMLMIAGAVAVLVVAFKLLESVDMMSVGSRLILLGIVMGSLAAVTVLMGKFGTPMEKGSLTILAFSGAVYILVAALEKMKDLKVDELKPKVLALVEIMASLALLSYGVGHIGVLNAVGLIALVWALKKVLPALNELAGTKFENLIKVIESNLDLIKKLGALAVAIVALESITGNGVKGFGLGLLAIAGAVLILTQVVKSLAEMNTGDMRKGLEFITQCFLMIGVLELLSFATIGNKFGRFAISLIPLTGAIALLGLITEYLGGIDANKLKNGTKALWQIVGMVAVLEVVSRLASPVSIGGIIAIIIGIAGIAGELIWLSKLKWEDVEGGLIAFGVALGALLIALSFASGIGSVGIGGIIAAIVMMAGTVAALDWLQQYNWKELLGSAVAFGVFLLALAGSMAILAFFGSPGALGLKAVGTGLLMFAETLFGILAICDILKFINDEVVSIEEELDILVIFGNKIGEAIGGFIGGAAQGIMDRLPAIGTDLSEFAENAESFFAITSGNNLASSAEGISAIADIFVKLGEKGLLDALTKWFGGETIDFDTFSAQLVTFGGAMVKYADTVSNLNTDAVGPSAEAASILVDLANTLPKENGWMQKIFGQGNWTTFSEGLENFGVAMVNYAQIVNGADLNESTFEASSKAAAMLVDLQSTFQAHGGLVQDIFGDTSWSSFSEGLEGFGTAMVNYADIVNGADLNESTFEASNKAAAMLVELESTFKTTGGVISWFTGDSSWTSFKSGLVGFGEALVKYSQTVSGDAIDADAIGKSIPAARALVRLGDEIPDDFDGIWAIQFGGKNWSTIGQDLPFFGKALSAYSNAVSEGNFDAANIDASVTAAGSLVTLANTIPSNFGGKIQELFGGSSWKTFGTNLDDFAVTLANYSNTISGTTLNTTAIQSSSAAAGALVDVLKNLIGSGLNSLGGNSKIGNNFKYFGENLTDFAETIGVYSTKIAGINWTNVQNSGNNIRTVFNLLKDLTSTEIGSLDNFNQALNSLATINLDSFINVFKNPVAADGSSLITSIDSLITTAANQLTTQANTTKFNEAGKTCVGEFISGLTSQTEILSTAGADVVNGFIAGIDLTALYESGAESGGQFLQGFRDETGWHSPWSTMVDAARDAIDGIKSGIERHASQLDESGHDFGFNFVEGIRDELGWHSEPDFVISLWNDIGLGVQKESDGLNPILEEEGAESGKSWSEAFRAEVRSTMEEYAPNALAAYDKGAAKVKKAWKGVKEASDSGTGKKFDWKEYFDIDDTIEEVEKTVEDLTHKFDDAGKAAGNYGNGAGKAGSGSKSAANGAKEAAKAAENHEKALRIETKAVKEFMKAFGDSAEQMSDTTAEENAKNAIMDLARAYAEAGDDFEGTEKEIEEALVKMYDEMQSSLSGSMDMFSKFTAEHSITGKEFIGNMQSQLTAVDEWAEGLQKLAKRGFTKSLIDELAKSGTSSMGKIRSLLKMSFDEMITTNSLWNSKKDAASNAAIKALTAMAYAGKTTQAVLKMAEDASNDVNAAAGKTTIEIAGRIDAINVSYQELYATVSETVRSQMDLFTKFDRKTDMTASTVLENMRSQVEGASEWANGLSVLYQRGIDEGLYNELAAMGPKSYELVNAFIQMSAQQLQQANTYYQQSLALPDTIGKQLSNQYLTVATNNLSSYINGLQSKQDDVNNATTGVISNANSAANTEAEKAKTIGENVDSSVAAGITDNEVTSDGAATDMMSSALTAADDYSRENAPVVGKNATFGVAAGSTSPEALSEVDAAGEIITNRLLSSIARAGQQGSPWKTTMESGRFAGLGLVEGIKMCSNAVDAAGTEITETTIDSMNSAISSFTDILSADIDLDPTIRPTLDLDDVEAKANLLSGMFDNQTVAMAGQISNVMPYGNRMMAALGSIQPGSNQSVSIGDIIVQTQPGQDPEAIAKFVGQEVYRQFLSREAVMM